MATKKISELTAASALAGTEEFEAVQSGSKKVTAAQIATYVGEAFGFGLVPCGRLTLTTATPVTVTDVTAATTIYYALHTGKLVPLWNGTRWIIYAISELSLALTSNSGHTGYQQSGKNFDLFIYDDGGTVRLCTGPAWTNDTTRADALGRKDGRWTNNASIVLRFGSSSGNTVTAAANRALYVGTMRASANGQCEDSLAKRFLWNCFNRVARAMRVTEGTDTWTYTTNSYRQANNSAANQLDFVRGLDEDAVAASLVGGYYNSASAILAYVAIGLDSTTTPATGTLVSANTPPAASAMGIATASWHGVPGLGRHYLAWLERSPTGGTTTWLGDVGGPPPQTGLNGQVFA